jgi:Fic family protein
MFKPTFTITPAILSGISEITEIKTIIERSRVLPLNQAQLQRQAIARMVHTSTSIEGNPLAQFQVDKVLAGEEINAERKAILEVKNYQKALQEMEKLADSGNPIGVEDILKLHASLMEGLLPKEKIGHFRPGPIYIVDDLGEKGDRLRFEGPEPKKVPFLVNELMEWLSYAIKSDLHPVLIAGLIHIQFVSIHPFSDGNGRMTRLLTQLVLYKLKWDFRKIIVLEDYYNRDRLAYYDAENTVQGIKYHEGADSTSWLEYFVKGFWVEAMKASEQIEKIGFNKVTDEADQIFLDRDETEIMDFLVTTGRITSQDVEEILNIAKRTAQLKLKNLVGKGLLKVEGSGPSTAYTIAQ